MTSIALIFKWVWGLVLTGVFVTTWGVMWGILPGTPAADEIRTDSETRWALISRLPPEDDMPVPLTAPLTRANVAKIRTLTLTQESDLSVLHYCSNLRSLRFWRYRRWDSYAPPEPKSGRSLAIEPALTKLEVLSVPGLNISSINRIDHYSALTSLDLGNNPLRSVQPLANLTHLRALDLGVYPESDRLRTHPGEIRTWLELKEEGGLPLDLTPLRQLTALEILAVPNRRVTSLDVLVNLTRLQRLDVSHNQLTSLAGIEQFPELSELAINNNQISDPSPLLALPKLRNVWLYGNPGGPNAQAVLDELSARGVTIERVGTSIDH